MGDEEYVCKVFIDGNLAFTQNFKFDGVAELRTLSKKSKFDIQDDRKLTVETSLIEVKFTMATKYASPRRRGS